MFILYLILCTHLRWLLLVFENVACFRILSYKMVIDQTVNYFILVLYRVALIFC